MIRKYDYSFLKGATIPRLTANYLATFEAKLGKFKLFLAKYPKIFAALSKNAIIQSVQSSNAIEGITTTNARIRMLVEGNAVPKNHDEEEILGYKDALKKIHEAHEHIQLNSNDILALHQTMLSYLNPDYGGKFKTYDNAIVAISANGHRSIRFLPVTAELTPPSMERLELAYTLAICDDKVHSILLIPCYILDFLCIHPFSDGNGRVSRLLTTLMLYRAGYDFVKYVSFENQIYHHRFEYYNALKLSSIEWHDVRNNYYYFVNNFLITLIGTLSEIEVRFNLLLEKKLTKEERIEATILSSLPPLRKRDLRLMWPDISASTIEKVLNRLQKSGKIKKLGMFKDAKYIRVI